MAKNTDNSTSGEGFPPELRVRSRDDFQRLYQRKCWVSDETMKLAACENGLDYARLGLAVGKKHGTAVRRNRWKRLIREAFRLDRGGLPAGIDVVLSPRESVEPDLPAIRKSLAALCRRAAKRLAGLKR